jgi:hypothetical protein
MENSIIGKSKNITVTPTIDTNIYASGDLVGTKLTLSNALRAQTGRGRIVSVTLVDQAKQSAALDVVFFNANPSGTTFTDNAALDVADADALKYAGHVSIVAGNYAAFADNSAATVVVSGAGIQVTATDSSTLYACLVSRATPTYAAATDLQLTVGIVQD